MRGILFIAAAALAACTPPAQRVDLSAVAECQTLQLTTGELNPGECKMMAGPAQLHVTFEAPATDGAGGVVRIDVLNDDGAVAQTFSETDVSQFAQPRIEDIDGDGRADILIGRVTGNVNTEYGVWVYSGADNAYRRAGDVSGVEISRTNDGYLAVSARSSAASWGISFYTVGASLEPLVTVSVTATDTTDDGQVRATECAIEAAPGLASLNMTEEAARAKFCAEPQAAGVFQ